MKTFEEAFNTVIRLIPEDEVEQGLDTLAELNSRFAEIIKEMNRPEVMFYLSALIHSELPAQSTAFSILVHGVEIGILMEKREE